MVFNINMKLLKILGLGIPLTLSSLFGFGQKDTTFVSNDTIPEITNLKYLGDSIIFEKQYKLIGGEYKLVYEKTSNIDQGDLIYTSELKYSYKTRPEKVEYYEKKNLGEKFKTRIQEDRFEEDSKLTFYKYDNTGKLKEVKIKDKKGTKEEYYLYKKNNKIRWKDTNNNGTFDDGDKMEVFLLGKWIKFEPKGDLK